MAQAGFQVIILGLQLRVPLLTSSLLVFSSVRGNCELSLKLDSWLICNLPQKRSWDMNLRLMLVQFYSTCSKEKPFIAATPKAGKEDFASTGDSENY